MFLTARSAMVDEKDLSPVIPVQIYSRIMRNLVNSHMILGNGDKALLWTERLRVLEQVSLPLSLSLSRARSLSLSLSLSLARARALPLSLWTERHTTQESAYSI